MSKFLTTVIMCIVQQAKCVFTGNTSPDSSQLQAEKNEDWWQDSETVLTKRRKVSLWWDFALSLKSKCISCLLSISQNKHHMSDANQCSHASTTVISFCTYKLETNKAISCASYCAANKIPIWLFSQILHARYLNPVSGRKTVCPSLVNIPKY